MTERNVTARKKSALEIFENIVILFFISSVIGRVYEFLFYIIVEHRVGNSGFFSDRACLFTASARRRCSSSTPL